MNPSEVAFLFTDAEPGIVEAIGTNTAKQLTRSISVAVKAAKSLCISVIATGVPLTPGTSPTGIPELADVPLIERRTLNAWLSPETRQAIEASGRKIVALGGVASEVAVLQTALSLREAGYQVHVLTDACGGLTERSEQSAWAQLRDAGVVLSSVPALVGQFVPDVLSPEGKELMTILSPFWS